MSVASTTLLEQNLVGPQRRLSWNIPRCFGLLELGYGSTVFGSRVMKGRTEPLRKEGELLPEGGRLS